MVGYSGTPLAKKLGMKPGMRVWLRNAPEDFEALLDGLPDDVSLSRRKRKAFDLIMCFATSADMLEADVGVARTVIPPDGVIWTAWPKKASKVPTDITEDRLRDMFLPTGLVDVKVCAIDETWSGLKFVIRKELR
jgi:hypothetical protein